MELIVIKYILHGATLTYSHLITIHDKELLEIIKKLALSLKDEDFISIQDLEYYRVGNLKEEDYFNIRYNWLKSINEKGVIVSIKLFEVNNEVVLFNY